MPQPTDDLESWQSLTTALRSHDYERLKRAAEVLRAMGEAGNNVAPDPFLATLLDDDIELRSAAAWILGELKERAPVEPLLAALHDAPDEVRTAAAWALKEAGSRVPLEQRIQFLADPSPTVRLAMLCALETRAPHNILLKALQDSCHSVRSTAAYVISRLDEKIPLDALVPILHAEDAGIRETAVGTLANRTDPAFLELLVAALGDPATDVRRDAAELSGQWGKVMPVEALRARLSDDHPAVRSTAAKSLARIGDPAGLAVILSELAIKKEYVRENTLSALQTSLDADRAKRDLAVHLPLEVLVDLLHDSHWPVGLMAAEFIGLRGDSASLKALVELMDDPEVVTREAAIEGLIYFGTRAPMDRLLAALDDEEAAVRRQAAHALEAFGTAVPVEALLPHLADDDAKVARAVAKLGHPAGIDALVRVLCTLESRWEAACALGELGGRAPASALVAAFGDSDDQVQFRAAEALYRTHRDVFLDITPSWCVVLLGTAPRQGAKTLESLRQTSCAIALGRLQSSAPALVTYLTDLLDWPYWETRMRAVIALGHIGPDLPAATLQTIERLRHDPESASVRKMASTALEGFARS
jgi:HEAT repeat protein